LAIFYFRKRVSTQEVGHPTKTSGTQGSQIKSLNNTRSYFLKARGKGKKAFFKRAALIVYVTTHVDSISLAPKRQHLFLRLELIGFNAYVLDMNTCNTHKMGRCKAVN
jgi:hypothetical protein